MSADVDNNESEATGHRAAEETPLTNVTATSARSTNGGTASIPTEATRGTVARELFSGWGAQLTFEKPRVPPNLVFSSVLGHLFFTLRSSHR